MNPRLLKLDVFLWLLRVLSEGWRGRGWTAARSFHRLNQSRAVAYIRGDRT